MKYIIWNKTKDKFWSNKGKDIKGHWSNRYYATKYTQEELEKILSNTWFAFDGDLILAMIAVNV